MGVICDACPVTTTAPLLDPILESSVDAARAALAVETDPADVGAHLAVHDDAEVTGDLVLTHLFECARAGYVGWRWSVTITRAADEERVTVDEVVLVPGPESVVAPSWVPYAERIQPGDLNPGDLLPVEDEDVRLVPTWSAGDDELSDDDLSQVRRVAGDLFAGRVRTLSVEGRERTAERWYDGDAGPESPLAKAASDHCGTCGFSVALAGPLSATFVVCANGNANDDGRVVSRDHGCGAHSEVKLARKNRPQSLPDHVFDSLTEEIEDF